MRPPIRLNPPITARMGEPPYPPPRWMCGTPKHVMARTILRYRFRCLAYRYDRPESVDLSYPLFRALTETEPGSAENPACSMYGVDLFYSHALDTFQVRIRQRNGAVAVVKL